MLLDSSITGSAFYVIAEDQVLVTQVEFPVDYDGVGPNLAIVVIAQSGFLGELEFSSFLESGRARFH